MAKELREPSVGLCTTPVVMVTCGHDPDSYNIITLAWVGVLCSSPPTLGISVRPSRFSHGLIKETGQFVVNVPTEELVFATDYCGVVSGRKANKAQKVNLSYEKASRVKAPLLAECPVNVECIVRQVISLGSHDLFLGEVVAVHVESSILNEDGDIDFTKLNAVTYLERFQQMRGEYWNLGVKLGSYGYSRRED
jgi:flavin reductase (DIM6/NTAB) family NADH-FMN oxidoreductase RutF